MFPCSNKPLRAVRSSARCENGGGSGSFSVLSLSVPSSSRPPMRAGEEAQCAGGQAGGARELSRAATAVPTTSGRGSQRVNGLG